tara:strand:- start:692 stop:952 length:261 start_codon:yes stop_codon:yes gene_type:complete
MAYRNKDWISTTGYLKDGREYKIEWLQRWSPATFEDPYECENDSPSLYIEGEYILDKEWPDELSDNIEALEADAVYDRPFNDGDSP